MELTKITKELLAQGWTKDQTSEGFRPWNDFYGGWEYKRSTYAKFVFQTPCGMLIKGDKVISDMAYMGVHWMVENDNPVIDIIMNLAKEMATTGMMKNEGGPFGAVVVDKEGNRNKFGKSLKQTSINLKWHELLDFTLPPIDKEEYDAYWKTIDRYRGMSLEHLNELITNNFERYVLPKYIEPMLYYNKNDVFLVCEMARQKPDEIKLRYSITQAFKVNVLCSARANIADKLTIAFYSKMSGLHQSQFEKGRTERTRLSFNKIIFPHIKFKTKQLQDLLEDMMKVYVYHTNKDDFCREITFYGTTYTLACGGIHTQDVPVVLESNDKYIYKDNKQIIEK